MDPRDVHELLDHRNGEVIVDVREQTEFEESHIPGAVHVPRGYLEQRIEGAAKDKDQRVVLYCQSGNRSALAAKTLQEELGYENVESMTGGITLWKDRGYDVEVPRQLTAEQRERYSRHLLIPEIGIEGQLKLLDAKVLLLGAAGSARRPRSTSPPPASARSGSWTTTWSTCRTSSARSPTPTTASACRRSTPPSSRSTRSTPTSRS